MDTAKVKELEIQLPFTEVDIRRMDMLGLTEEQIIDVATIGICPDMPIHWHSLVMAIIYNYDIPELPNMACILNDPGRRRRLDIQPEIRAKEEK